MYRTVLALTNPTLPSLDLHNYNLATYQKEQINPGATQLRKRVETVSVRVYMEVEHGTYCPPVGLIKGPQHWYVGGPGGKNDTN